MSRRRTIRTPPSPVPTHRLSDASPSSILCHSVANPVPIRCQSCANLIPIRPLMADWSWIGIGLGPSSIKTREVLGNPSLMPKRFPETRKISRGRSLREILRVEGNLEGRGDGFPNLLSFGGGRTFSHHQFFYREWIRKSFPVDREGLTVLKSILPC